MVFRLPVCGSVTCQQLHPWHYAKSVWCAVHKVVSSCHLVELPTWRSRVVLLQVFCATGSEAQERMRQACFEYLSLGGIYSSGELSGWELLALLRPTVDGVHLKNHDVAVEVATSPRLIESLHNTKDAGN